MRKRKTETDRERRKKDSRFKKTTRDEVERERQGKKNFEWMCKMRKKRLDEWTTESGEKTFMI